VAEVRARFGALSDRFLQIYPADTTEQAREAHYNSYRDLSFGWQMRTWVRMQTRTGKAKAYLYYFSHVPPGPLSACIKAYHAGEISYVFDNVRIKFPASTETDDRLADTMSSYWANFAATGNPSGKGLPQWPAYDAATDTALEFGDTVKPVADLHKPALDFIDEYYAIERARK